MAAINKIIKEGKNSENKVLANMALVYTIAKKYQGMGHSLEDLIQEGTIGLCKAVEKYDAEKGAWSSYAWSWIKAYIIKSLNQTSRAVRLPDHIAQNEALTKAAEVHVSVLDDTYQGVAEAEVDVEAELTDTQKRVVDLLSVLKEKDQMIVRMKFGIGYDEEMESKEIAAEFGISVQMINYRFKQAIKKMQK